MVLSNDVAIRWIRSALEMHLLDSAEAAQFLLEAADGDHSLYRVVSAHFTDCPVRLAELHALLEQLRDDPYATILTDADNGPDSVSLPSCDTDEPTTPNGRPQSKSARKPPEESTNRRRTCEAAGKQHLPMPLLSGIDRYDLQAEIGRGGCGVVSQALDRQLQRTVVLKRIADRLTGSDEIVQRFLNEARITGQLEHPGIVPVYEMGLDEHGLPFYAMRQIRGVTMADRIRALHQLPAGRERIVLQRQLLDRFRDVCQTLAYAHHSGVIHRDLKPANVMIGEFGETVLLDWGLARKLSKAGKTCSRESGHDDSDDETLPSGIREDSASATGESAEVPRGCAASYSELTQHGTIMGTATYMAPEQALGQTHLVNEQSDVFSLGVILYELLSGTSPFKTDSVETTIQRVAQCKFRPLRDLDRSIPRPLAAICERAMRRAQEDRYQSAYELAADLESFLAGGPVGVYRERAWERLDRVANKHPVVFRTIFVGSLLVAAISLTAANRIAVSHSHERQARETAVVARNDAEAAWAGERDSRMRTQTQLVASRDAADKWLLQLSGDLQFYPGLQPLRRKLIEQGREHYHQLLADSLATHQALRRLPKAADPLEVVISATEVARNYLRSGDLSHLAGDDAAAMTHFCATEQLLLDTLNHTGFGLQQDPVLATQMANAWIGKSLARPPAAEDNDLDRDIVRAIDMLTEVLAADPDCDDARHALVRARALAARTAADHQAWQDADELISQALPDAQIL
ncbi:MAG: serine/threonine protein kinase, partial [Planctomycetales bacterium]|nr:serine/threonine protein kinase [Planctomycetales bacterium]